MKKYILLTLCMLQAESFAAGVESISDFGSVPEAREERTTGIIGGGIASVPQHLFRPVTLSTSC